MTAIVHDPYTIREASTRHAPATLAARLRRLGPSIVISGSIVGSGELILTSSLGAAAGFVLFWWVLVACWSKSIVQAELARYIVVSGDTYLRGLNRIPGRLPGPRGPVSWTLWFGLLAFIPGVVGVGGIIGGTGQALSLFMPAIDSRWTSAIIALVASAILCSGTYPRLERTMLVLVAGFTAATLISAIAMQFTPYRLVWSDVAAGLEFRLPSEHLVLALAMYGATGVNSSEIPTYSYWCIEKGYPSFVGGDRSDPDWPARARGWIRLLHVDIWVTLVILTCATLPFFLLGAGVLHDEGLRPQGLETIKVLSGMFTRTLGQWAYWLFGLAAFCILFSSVVAGTGGVTRLAPDYLVEFGLLERAKLATRIQWTHGLGAVLPVASLLFYLMIPSPVMLLTIGALAGAVLLPIQSGATLWLQRYRMDPRARPSRPAHVFLWLTFLFHASMAALVLVYAIP
jgi:Mn2+/Fe2+ NRAMP family transporter